MAGLKTTLAGATVSISTTAVTLPLNAAAFAALTFTPIGSAGNLGDYGSAPNMVTYNVLDTEVSSKAKGVEDAGELSIEVARIFDDPGQIVIRAAAATKFYYAIKLEYSGAIAISCRTQDLRGNRYQPFIVAIRYLHEMENRDRQQQERRRFRCRYAVELIYGAEDVECRRGR